VKPEAIAREIDRRVTAEEIRAAVETEITAAEREAFNELVTWFMTRYPTPEARLAYVRRAYRRWVARAGAHDGRG
jgi:hypothetical protein